MYHASKLFLGLGHPKAHIGSPRNQDSIGVLCITRREIIYGTRGEKALATKFDIKGFPFYFQLILLEPNLQIPLKIGEKKNKLANKKLLWRGRRATIEMRPWDLDSYKVDLSGSQDLSLVEKGVFYEFSSKANIIHIHAENAYGGWPGKIQLRVDDFNLLEKKSKSMASIQSVLLNIKKSAPAKITDPKVSTSAAFFVQLKLRELNLAGSFNSSLGNAVQEFSTNFRVMGHLDPVLSKRNIINWRNAGGIIEIDSMRGIVGSLTFYGTGTLALDKKLQPLVAMSANFEGILQTIDGLEKKGYINSKKALLAKVMLNLFSKNTVGLNGAINLPVTVQDRKLSVGPVPLAQLPEINWATD